MTDQDFRFANPPLAEVVAELHWTIQPIQSIPGGGLDPHFDVFQSEFHEAMRKNGFVNEERLVPPGVPMEYFGHQVVYRYRQRPGSWPAIQIGPGVLTVNIVPPYDGWSALRSMVATSIAALFASYPIAEKYLKTEKIQLRYIDAFTGSHGFDGRYGPFLRENLNLSVCVPDAVTAYASDPDDVIHILEVRLPVKDLGGAVGSIGFAPGIVNGQQAAVAQFSITEQNLSAVPKTPDLLAAWLDGAHRVLHEWFISIPKAELLKKMGNRIAV